MRSGRTLTGFAQAAGFGVAVGAVVGLVVEILMALVGVVTSLNVMTTGLMVVFGMLEAGVFAAFGYLVRPTLRPAVRSPLSLIAAVPVLLHGGLLVGALIASR